MLVSCTDININTRREPFQRMFDTPCMYEQLPYAASAISQYGQLTPPRSNPTMSSKNSRASAEQDYQALQEKRNTRTKVKKVYSTNFETSTTTRKCKASRKSKKPATQPATEEVNKRKLSLEKNKLAAAKCRVNKKDKTEQLQRDSQDKAFENKFLRQTIVQMNKEIQQLHTVLLSHVFSDCCENAKSIHEIFSGAGLHNFTLSQMTKNKSFSIEQPEPTPRPLGHDQSMHCDYFQPHEAPALLEFNLSAEFEICTPVLND